MRLFNHLQKAKKVSNRKTVKTLLQRKFQILFKQSTQTTFEKYFSCLINEKLLKQFNLSRDVNVTFYFSSLITEKTSKAVSGMLNKYVNIHFAFMSVAL